jgi:hypothetical protein
VHRDSHKALGSDQTPCRPRACSIGRDSKGFEAVDRVLVCAKKIPDYILLKPTFFCIGVDLSKLWKQLTQPTPLERGVTIVLNDSFFRIVTRSADWTRCVQVFPLGGCRVCHFHNTCSVFAQKHRAPDLRASRRDGREVQPTSIARPAWSFRPRLPLPRPFENG